MQFNSDDIQKIFMDDNISDEVKEKLKKHLPKKYLSQIPFSKNYNIGDIVLLQDRKYYLIIKDINS